MRSISYLLTGEPSCFADCVDYLSDNELIRATVELKNDDTTNQQILIGRRLGDFTWHFRNRVVTYHEEVGGIVLTESPGRQQKSLENANRRLERRLRDFEHFGIDLEGHEARFE